MLDTGFWILVLVEDPIFSDDTGRLQGPGSFCQVAPKKKERSDMDL
jgi:hypothetical protein